MKTKKCFIITPIGGTEKNIENFKDSLYRAKAVEELRADNYDGGTEILILSNEPYVPRKSMDFKAKEYGVNIELFETSNS